MWSTTLSKLPVEVLALNIMPMLALKDVIRVETAVVSHPEWWQAALQASAPLALDSHLQASVLVLIWIFYHGLQVEEVNYTPSSSNYEIFELLNYFCALVKKANIPISSIVPSAPLIAKCSCLRIGQVFMPHLVDAVQNLSLDNLTKLDLLARNGTSEALALKIFETAPNVLKISLNVEQLSEGFMAAFRSQGAKVTSLWLSVDTWPSGQIEELVACCPNLKSLAIEETFTFSFASATAPATVAATDGVVAAAP